MTLSRTIAYCCVLIAGGWWTSTAISQAVHDQSVGEESYPAAPRGKPDWRYRYYQGRWWYWLPSNAWAYHNGQRWVPYSRRVVRRPAEPLQANGNRIASNRRYTETDAMGRWPNINNGSGVTASPQPGGAKVGGGSLPPRGRWPRIDNGSGVDAAPEPGGAPPGPNTGLPPRGRWPRIDNGSGVDASPEPGGAAFTERP